MITRTILACVLAVAVGQVATAQVRTTGKAPAIGSQPTKSGGKIAAVDAWLQENLDDPSKLQYVSTSEAARVEWRGESFWGARVKFRATNKFGAKVLEHVVFLMVNGRVTITVNMNDSDPGAAVYAARVFPIGTFPGEGPIQIDPRVKSANATNQFFKDLTEGNVGNRKPPRVKQQSGSPPIQR